MRSKNDQTLETRTLLQQIDDFEKYLRKRFIKHVLATLLLLLVLGGAGATTYHYYREPLKNAWVFVSQYIPGPPAYHERIAEEKRAANTSLAEIKKLAEEARIDGDAAMKFAEDGGNLAKKPIPLDAATPHVKDAVIAANKSTAARDILVDVVAAAIEAAKKPDPVATAAQIEPARKLAAETKAGKFEAEAAYNKIKSLRDKTGVIAEIEKLVADARADAEAAKKFAKDSAELANKPPALAEALAAPPIAAAAAAAKNSKAAADALGKIYADAKEFAKKPVPVATVAPGKIPATDTESAGPSVPDAAADPTSPVQKYVNEAKAEKGKAEAGKNEAEAAYKKIEELRNEAKKATEEEIATRKVIEERKKAILDNGTKQLAKAEDAAMRAEADRDAADQRADNPDSPVEARPRADEAKKAAADAKAAADKVKEACAALQTKVAAIGNATPAKDKAVGAANTGKNVQTTEAAAAKIENDFRDAEAEAKKIEKLVNDAVKAAGDAKRWFDHTRDAKSRFAPVEADDLKETATPIPPQ